MKSKIGFGGGCHWCTESVFKIIRGVSRVEQGWIASTGGDAAYSEAVQLTFDTQVISLEKLVAIHLYTHSSTSNHPMRVKYRSAIYFFNSEQKECLVNILAELQNDFDEKLITRILSFVDFKLNEEKYLNYYEKNKENSFCKLYIEPKLKLLMTQFSKNVNSQIKKEIGKDVHAQGKSVDR